MVKTSRSNTQLPVSSNGHKIRLQNIVTMRPVSQIVSIWLKQPREVWTALQFTRNLAQCIHGLERSNLYDIHHFTPPIAINILTACTLQAASFYHPAPIAPPLPPRPAGVCSDSGDSGDIHSNMFRCLKMWYPMVPHGTPQFDDQSSSIISFPISWYLMAIIGGIPNFQTNPDQFGTAKWTYSQTGNTLSTYLHLLTGFAILHDFVGQSSFFPAIRNMTSIKSSSAEKNEDPKASCSTSTFSASLGRARSPTDVGCHGHGDRESWWIRKRDWIERYEYDMNKDDEIMNRKANLATIP